MALSANREVDHYIDQEIRTLQVAASQHVYKGALIGLTTGGYARPLSAGDAFAGIAYEEIDNTSGSDGDKSVRLYTLGDFGLSLTGAAITDVGRPVFASADDTLTFVSASNSYVGLVQDVIAGNQIILRIDADGRQVKTITHAVENVTAGTEIVARAVHSFSCDAWIVAARIVNQTTAAAGIDDSNTCVATVSVDAGTLASETFDSTTAFPAVNTVHDLGSLANAHVSAGDVLTFDLVNGNTSDPGPFVVEIDYV